MSNSLFVSERPRPQITTRPLSVGCLIFSQMDQSGSDLMLIENFR